jgi:hypothetical protein
MTIKRQAEATSLKTLDKKSITLKYNLIFLHELEPAINSVFFYCGPFLRDFVSRMLFTP